MANVRVHFYGLCLCVIDRANARVSVLLLNAGLSTGRFPYHYPLLIAAPGTYAGSDVAVLPELRGRVGGQHHGRWGVELGGWRVDIGDPAAGLPAMTHTPALMHPPTVAGPWTDLGWVADLARINPGCTLRPEYREVGRHVLARIDLHGGVLTGGTPSDAHGASYVWSFSPACEQAITDTLVWEGTVADDIIRFSAGPLMRQLQLGAGAGAVIDLWISHEAGPIERDTELALIKSDPDALRALRERPTLPHFAAFYDAVSGGPYQLVEPPAGTWRYDPLPVIPYQDTPYCVLAQIAV